MTVVDASVAVKWFLPEPGSEQALKLLGAGQALIAPDLIRTDVPAAITRKVRMNGLDAADAKECVRLWLDALKDGVVQVNSSLEDLREGANLALQLHHNIYDCVYLALARRISARLVTADGKFFEKAITVYPALELLQA